MLPRQRQLEIVLERYGEASRSDLRGDLKALPNGHALTTLFVCTEQDPEPVVVHVFNVSRTKPNEGTVGRDNWSISIGLKRMCDHLSMTGVVLINLNSWGVEGQPHLQKNEYRVVYVYPDYGEGQQGVHPVGSLLTHMKDPESFYLIEAGYLHTRNDWRVIKCD